MWEVSNGPDTEGLCLTDVRPYHPLVHLRSTIQLNHCHTVGLWYDGPVSGRLPLRLLGAGDAWQPT
jgi:hypothetical protein